MRDLLIFTRIPGFDPFHDRTVHLLANALLCMFAPLDTGKGIVVYDETAGAAPDRCITGEDLDLPAALRAFLYREGGSAQVCRTRAVVQHVVTPVSVSACQEKNPVVVSHVRRQSRYCSQDPIPAGLPCIRQGMVQGLS